MTNRYRVSVWMLSALVLLAGSLTFAPLYRRARAQQPQEQISPQAQRQIESLLAEKKNRTPEQRKIESQLLYEMKQQRGEALTREVPRLETNVKPDPEGRVLIDIRAHQVSDELLQLIARLEGTVQFSSVEDKTIRAEFPLKSLEDLARSADVRFIEPAVEAINNSRPYGAGQQFIRQAELSGPAAQIAVRDPQFAARAARVKAQLRRALPSLRAATAPQTPAGTGRFVSQGDRGHRADFVRDAFGVDGTGVRIGVLSDSVRYLEQSQASGDLPPDVTVVPGESGITPASSLSGEGTAMMEIIYDLAPGAKLFFATAFLGDARFAANIRRLRTEFKCDIIVDDVFYFNENPFQDALIARAVNDVVADGALYFSAAGNEGNVNDGTAGVWEGDFRDGGTLSTLPFASEYKVHDFSEGVISNRLRVAGVAITLFWSDPLGGSANDYDLFVLDPTLTTVRSASLTFQSGTQDPFEIARTFTAGDRIVIAKDVTAAPRALHLNTLRGELAIATVGQTHGHSAAAGVFAVAAVPALVARGGAFTGGPTNPVETFTSDGPRRIFFNANGSPVTPGNLLFATSGGTVRQKPDITAADGVSTSVPGFANFFGTSAAAPHAAAIAALLKSGIPQLTNDRLREALTTTALDIGPPGYDRTAGSGIIMPLPAWLKASPTALLEVAATAAAAVPTEGDGDAFIEPGEGGALTVRLVNNGNATGVGVIGTLTTTTPGVVITMAESPYPDLAPGGSGSNLNPFKFRLESSLACGARADFTLSVKAASGVLSRSYRFSVQTGQLSAPGTFSYTGPPVPIPDSNSAGVNVSVPVSGLSGAIGSIRFRIDGTNCNSSTGVGLDHTFIGDLVLRLTSPAGTTVTLMSQPGGPLNAGRNFCNTLLDDAASTSIQDIRSSGAPPLGPPYTGTFRPASPLSAFAGQNPNGTWTLNVIDRATPDTGNVRAFSILITTYQCEDSRPFLVSGAELSRAAQSNELLARITLRNDGISASGPISLTAASLGNSADRVNVTGALPVPVGNLAPGQAATFTLRFDGAKFPPGANVTLLYLCSYSGGTFSGGHGLIAP